MRSEVILVEMKKNHLVIITIFIVILISLPISFWIFTSHFNRTSLSSPFVKTPEVIEKPYTKYTIENLSKREYVSSTIYIEDILEENDTYTSYLFSYTSLNKKITGQLNIPNFTTQSSLASPTDGELKVIVMLRGYVPAEIYETGLGTRNAAAVFAKNGYITIAPDFPGYGGSDPDFEDSWEGRFTKPINVIELIKSIESMSFRTRSGISLDLDDTLGILNQVQDYNNMKIGIWAHSNGGQIALTMLEILNEPIPTTLWAPVTAPFPYSVLFYSDENDDEGKAARAWVALFERDYDAFDFSITQHLDRLTGPLQIHQGTTDDAVPYSWNDEFVEKLKAENTKRALRQNSGQATHSPRVEAGSAELKYEYYTYSNTDHNLQPNWGTAVNRDLEFFKKNLSIEP